MNSASVVLLSNASATGAAAEWPGGRGFFHCAGTWNGGTVQLQYKGANGSFISVQVLSSAAVLTAVPLAADGGFVFDLPPCTLKATVTGSPSALYANAARVTS